jgi:hypothetical protein
MDDTNARLDTIIRLMAAMLVRDMDKGEAIIKLGKMQLSREQIADVVGVTTHNVSQVLYAAGKKTDGKPKKSPRNADQAVAQS